MKEMKRQRTSGRDREENRDILSELPDCLLIHIINLMDTKLAVQTCVLSKRWKNLWKHLTNVSFNSLYFNRIFYFEQFVSHVLSIRDSSISLRSLDFTCCPLIAPVTDPTLMIWVMKYAVLHNVQHLTINLSLRVTPDFEFVPYIFSCSSLSSLKIFHKPYVRGSPSRYKLLIPKSLQLPVLKSLHLKYVTFTASENDCAEPFSTCNKLDTLVLRDCVLHNDVKVLCISNSNLSSLTIEREAYNIDLSTPNLSSFTILRWANKQISSKCNLSVLEEVNIDSMFGAFSSSCGKLLNLSCLQLLANVKIMTLSSDFIKIILIDLSNCRSTRTQPPCFVRLKSLKVKVNRYAILCGLEVKRIVEYLLQNSPLASVDVIDC